MRRNVDLNEISDGKLYTSNDMVKAADSSCRFRTFGSISVFGRRCSVARCN